MVEKKLKRRGGKMMEQHLLPYRLFFILMGELEMEQKDTTSYDEVAAAGCLDFGLDFWHSDCSSLQH